uniref:Apyrase n=1 Tax=Opuntia streptacantha TaxID=393608 RepID=A0A7C9A3G5_OPUST
MEPQTPSKTKLSIMGLLQSHRILKICLIFTAIVLVSAGSFYGYSKMREGKPYFTVVVDCGSTGTRVNVYEWRLTGGGNGDLPSLLHSYPDDPAKSRLRNSGCHYHCMQTEPGLDKFVGNSSGVSASLEPLIRWAEGLVPQDRHVDTPVFVLATAGLRRLPQEDAKRLLEDVENVIKKHSFMWRRSWIRVLNGREEAHYGWIALNYKMRRLNSPSRLPTLGLLDLGGSSLQIAMEASDTRKDNHLLPSRIGSKEHQLMAYSLPSFGLNKAFDRTVSMLTQVNSVGNETGSEVRHPCLSSRFVGNHSCGSCSTPYSLLHLVGDPNWERCKIVAKAAAMNTSFRDWSEPSVDSSCRRNSPTDGECDVFHHRLRIPARQLIYWLFFSYTVVMIDFVVLPC